MSRKPRFKKNDKFGKWELTEYINSGGNGEVWKVKENGSNDDGQNVIKILLNNKQLKSRQRFNHEITQVEKYQEEVSGILPIKDSHATIEPLDKPLWYVMPFATPISEYFENGDNDILNKVSLLATLAESLHELHEYGVSHRDIKPDNLFIYNEHPCLGDFGLVDYPNKQDLTTLKERVGPVWTIAPEMKRNAKNANGIKADAYSFAKTIWILLTKQEKGFEGQYHVENESVELTKYHPNLYSTVILDKLLADCTNDEPKKRPDLKEVAQKLREWCETEKSSEESNLIEWDKVQRQLFPVSIPKTVCWSHPKEILNVLSLLSRDEFSHFLFPTGGGVDICRVKDSYEQDCIELHLGKMIFILKPKRLIVESFSPTNLSLNYFWLETYPLKQLSLSINDQYDECLTEIDSKPSYADKKFYGRKKLNGDKDPLPNGVRLVWRVLKGNFMIFAKASIFNKIPYGHIEPLLAKHNNSLRGYFVSFLLKNNLIEKTRISEQSTGITYIDNIPDLNIGRAFTDVENKLLQKFKKILEEEKKEDAALNSFDSGIDVIDFSEPDIVMENLRKSILQIEPRMTFLKELPLKELQFLYTVMYVGRDHQEDIQFDIDDMITFHCEGHNKSSLIFPLKEKPAMAILRYIEHFLKMYKKES